MSVVRRIIRRLVFAVYTRCIRPHVAAQLREWALNEPRIFGDPARVIVAPTAKIWNAYINVASGTVRVDEFAFFANNVSLVTGKHDYDRTDRDRQDIVPPTGSDIVVGRGAWIGTNAIILGPCVIGEHAVIAAGAVVTGDVEPYTIVAGIPARVIRKIRLIEETN